LSGPADYRGARDAPEPLDERVDARARLRASEDRFAALAAASGQMVWTARADGQVDEAPSWRAYTGPTRVGPAREGPARVLAGGRGWFDAVHPEDRPAVLAGWSTSLITRRAYDVECRLRRADGVYRWVRARAVPRSDADGILREWIGTCADIHEARTQAEESVLALRAAQRRMDEFLGIASHELRTPLTVIYANLQLLATRLGALAASAATAHEPASDLSRRLDGMLGLALRGERHARRLNRLVGDLLDVSRIHDGKLEPRPERCDPLAVVREAVEAQRMTWPGRTIHLKLPAGGRDVAVMADPSRIEQVVTNFLSNALKYSPPGRPVTVRVRVESGATPPRVRVAVRDRGPGLPPEERDHVWSRFYRAAGITERSGSAIGLGLGLYISRTIVERHGGAVGVEGAPGEGSTFWFTLPLAGPAA
jgi:signal transduction histidine kinase